MVTHDDAVVAEDDAMVARSDATASNGNLALANDDPKASHASVFWERFEPHCKISTNPSSEHQMLMQHAPSTLARL